MASAGGAPISRETHKCFFFPFFFFSSFSNFFLLFAVVGWVFSFHYCVVFVLENTFGLFLSFSFFSSPLRWPPNMGRFCTLWSETGKTNHNRRTLLIKKEKKTTANKKKNGRKKKSERNTKQQKKKIQ